MVYTKSWVGMLFSLVVSYSLRQIAKIKNISTKA
jgi:hypothetical protein